MRKLLRSGRHVRLLLLAIVGIAMLPLTSCIVTDCYDPCRPRRWVRFWRGVCR